MCTRDTPKGKTVLTSVVSTTTDGKYCGCQFNVENRGTFFYVTRNVLSVRGFPVELKNYHTGGGSGRESGRREHTGVGRSSKKADVPPAPLDGLVLARVTVRRPSVPRVPQGLHGVRRGTPPRPLPLRRVGDEGLWCHPVPNLSTPLRSRSPSVK